MHTLSNDTGYILFRGAEHDFEPKASKKVGVRNTFCTTWQETQPLSPMHESCPEEVVARLLEHEALTALLKANFNLFQKNGIEDVS